MNASGGSRPCTKEEGGGGGAFLCVHPKKLAGRSGSSLPASTL